MVTMYAPSKQGLVMAREYAPNKKRALNSKVRLTTRVNGISTEMLVH